MKDGYVPPTGPRKNKTKRKRKNKPQWNDNTRIAIFKTPSGQSRVRYSKSTFEKSVKLGHKLTLRVPKKYKK